MTYLDLVALIALIASIIHRLRSDVHALLGDKIFYLTLAGLGFALLAGKGASLIFNDLNRQRQRYRLGWTLLAGGLFLGGLCLLLSLP